MFRKLTVKLVQNAHRHSVVPRRVDFSTGNSGLAKFNQPTNQNELPRYAGINTMCRLPLETDTTGLDAAFVGVPIDIGTTHRSGTRHGPRQIRAESTLIRGVNIDTGAVPFDSLQVADVGDLYCTPFHLPDALRDIKKGYARHIATGCRMLAMGGDHSLTYPILQAIKEKYGPVGLIQIDAHSDTVAQQNASDVTHGTSFFRAVEEGCIDASKVVQIGLRGSVPILEEFKFAKEKGFRLVRARDCWYKSLEPLMEEVRQQMGPSAPVYVSFDIDGLDPAYAPGTGTPEIGGLTTIQALEIVRGCRGLNIIGADVVEVSPAYDKDGTTALTAANLLFELLCVLPGVKYEDVAYS